MGSEDVANLRAAEGKLLARLAPAERMLFNPKHERHPRGEDWWRKLSIFRGWLGQLREVRRELADLGQEIQYCPVCGSIAWFDGQLVGCHDCRPTDATVDEVDRRLMTDGYVVIPAKQEVVLVVRESDTSVPDVYAGAVRYSVEELVRFIGTEPEDWRAAIALVAVFLGVDLAVGGPEPLVSENKGEPLSVISNRNSEYMSFNEY